MIRLKLRNLKTLTDKDFFRFLRRSLRITTSFPYGFNLAKESLKKFFFPSIRVFFQGHWRLTGQWGKGRDHLLFHSATSIRSRTFRHLFFNFAREMTITYLASHITYWPVYNSMRFTTLSYYYLSDWWCDVAFCLFTCWFDSRFLLQLFETGNRWTRTRSDYHPCITSKQTNQVC